MNSPVIIIGMHRSGTSLLAKTLGQLGLFSGAHRDEHDEAVLFKQLNDWTLGQCGARWDTPEPIHYLWDNEVLLQKIEQYLRDIIFGPASIAYLGLRRYRSGGVMTLADPWGWKDPRNVFMLPIWLRIFPEAKVINIKRHGVDVAQSLFVRSQMGFAATTARYQKYKFLLLLRRKRGGFIESPRCATLKGGFSLWSEYLDQARVSTSGIAKDRLLEIKYERLLDESFSEVKNAAEFCGLEIDDDQIRRLTKGINADRAYSYRRDADLLEFASSNQAKLSAYEYGESHG